MQLDGSSSFVVSLCFATSAGSTATVNSGVQWKGREGWREKREERGEEEEREEGREEGEEREGRRRRERGKKERREREEGEEREEGAEEREEGAEEREEGGEGRRGEEREQRAEGRKEGGEEELKRKKGMSGVTHQRLRQISLSAITTFLLGSKFNQSERGGGLHSICKQEVNFVCTGYTKKVDNDSTAGLNFM